MPSDFLSCAGGRVAAPAHRPLLDVLYRVRNVNHTLYEDAGRDDVIGVDVSALHEMLDLGHRNLSRSRHHGIEVARGLAVNKIPFGVAHPCMYDCYVGYEAALHDLALSL